MKSFIVEPYIFKNIYLTRVHQSGINRYSLKKTKYHRDGQNKITMIQYKLYRVDSKIFKVEIY